MQTVYMISLGCDKNTVDAQIMMGLLCDAGYLVIQDAKKAAIIIVNTCGFIDPAKEESIEYILKAAMYKEEGNCMKLIVAGCLSQRYAKQLLTELPEVDAFMGTGDIDNIVDVVQRALSGDRFVLNQLPKLSQSSHRRLINAQQVSEFVKIAEGCNNCCTYCVIPSLRGAFQSRTIEDITAEVQYLAKQGIKEVILVAQDTTSYGIDIYGAPALTRLLAGLLQVQGPIWYRLLYCYPTNIDNKLLSLMANEDRIANYLDIPLQHADPRILKAMNRPDCYGLDWIKSLRKQVPHLTLRTTFIVGFPGEDEAAFNKLQKFIEQAQFDHLGVFKYSQEEGTPAAQFPKQVSEETKERRRQLLMQQQQNISQRRNVGFIGRTITVILEEHIEDDLWSARGEKDAPEVDGLVYVEKVTEGYPGKVIGAHIFDAMEYDLRGEMVQ